MNDDLDRMFHQLVTSITSRSPEGLTRPFAVADLYQDILPYRLFRRELGLDTNQDYEMTLLELLSGARGYLIVDERMADTLRRELASPNPDPGAFRQFSTTQVAISPDALAEVARAQAGGAAHDHAPRPVEATERAGLPRAEPLRAEPPRAETPRPAGSSGAMSAIPDAAPRTPASGRLPITPAPGESCRFCGGALPPGRPLIFCPHCGQDQTVLHCQACGAELEVGWNYCTTCGRGVAPG